MRQRRRILLPFAVAGILGLVCSGLIAYSPNVYGFSGNASVPTESGYVGSSGVAPGDIDMDGHDIYNIDSVYREAETTDTVPSSLYIESANSYSQATGANQEGSDIYLIPGSGTKQVVIDNYNNCATDFIWIFYSLPPAAGTYAALTEGTEWNRGASNSDAATSLAAAFDAVSGFSASATGAMVEIFPDQKTFTFGMVEGDATCTTLADGLPGKVIVPDLSSVAWGDGGESIIGDNLSRNFGMYTDGLTLRLSVSYLGAIFYVPFKFASKTVINGTVVDGDLTVSNWAQNDFGCFKLGGVTNAFGGVCRDGAGVKIGLADGSDNSDLAVDQLTADNTDDIGWSVQSAANQACNTTCTFACVFGLDGDTAKTSIVGCADAAADDCLCAGGS